MSDLADVWKITWIRIHKLGAVHDLILARFYEMILVYIAWCFLRHWKCLYLVAALSWSLDSLHSWSKINDICSTTSAELSSLGLDWPCWYFGSSWCNVEVRIWNDIRGCVDSAIVHDLLCFQSPEMYIIFSRNQITIAKNNVV